MSPDAVVIPESATTYAVCIESSELRAQKWLDVGAASKGENQSSDDGDDGEPYVAEPYVAEPYTCMLLEHLQHKKLTDTFEVCVLPTYLFLHFYCLVLFPFHARISRTRFDAFHASFSLFTWQAIRVHFASAVSGDGAPIVEVFLNLKCSST